MMYSTSSCFRDTKSSDLDSLVLRIPSQAKWNQFGCILLRLPNYLLWNAIIMLTAILNYILMVIDIAFAKNLQENLLIFYITFDVFYLLNLLILILHKTFSIASASRIPKEDYSLLIIVLDLISLMPQLLLLLLLVDYSFRFFIPFLRIPTILRLRHLLLFRKVLGKLPENRWIWFMAEYASVFCLLLHTIICMWYFLECGVNCNNQFNITPPRTFDDAVSWYFYHNYYTIQLLLNIGFGDIYPKNFGEIYLFSVLLFIGQGLTVWLVSYVTWLLINRNYHKIKIHYKINDALKYIEEDTDDATKLKLAQYYSMKEHKGFKEKSFLDILPLSLQQDISYDLNCGLLHRSLILKELPEPLLKRISVAMKSVTLLAGESIFFQYVVKTCMVCIEDGILEILNDEDQDSPVIFFRNGTILGEVALFFNIPSKASVRAGTNTELKILEKKDFLEIMFHFPENYKCLQAVMSKRLLSATKPRKTIHKFCLPSLRRLKVKLSDVFVKDDIDLELEEEYYDLYRLYGDKNRIPNIDGNLRGLRGTWKVLSDVAQVVMCLLYPYYAIFEKEVPAYLNYFGLCTDISCLLDIILQSTIPIKFQGMVVTSFTGIIDQKLNSWKFNLDILSLFPIEVWSYLYESTIMENRFYDIFRLNRLLRLHRITGLLNLLNGGNNYSLVSKIFSISVYSLLILYYSSCLLYLNACFDVICDDSSWYYLIPRKPFEEIEDSRIALIDSFYFTTTSIFYTGIGDILPKALSDYIIIIILVIFFLILKSYWVGQIISTMFLNILCSGFLETKYYMHYLSEVHRIPKTLKNKLYNFLKIDRFFYREKSKQFIKETVPSSMEALIQISRINDVWRNHRFFKKVDPYLLALIENEVQFWILPKNETAYFYGDPTRRMYVIKKGYCDLYNSENVLEKTVGPGTQLGRLEMIYCLPKKYTVVTRTDCILFYLEFSMLDNILKLFIKEFNILETVTFQKDLLESVAEMEIYEDAHEINEVKDPTEKEEHYFINISEKWPNYCEVYRKKLGIFWCINFFLMPMAISPDGFFMELWCITRSFFIVLQTIVYTVVIMAPPFADELSWITWICQCTLYVEMYLNLHIGYYDGTGKMMVHPGDTSYHYLTHVFILDLISAIPWSYIIIHPEFSHENMEVDKAAIHSNHCFWNLLKFLQCIKVFQCISYFEQTYFTATNILKVFKLLMVIIISANVLTSIGVSYIWKYVFDIKNRRSIFDPSKNGIYRIGNVKNDNKFLENNLVSNSSSGSTDMYTLGLYTILDWMTNTGTGLFQPSALSTKSAAILTVLFGFFLFAILTGAICTIMLSEAEEAADFRDNVSLLLCYLRKCNTPANLITRVIGHFNLIWDRTNGFNMISEPHCNSYFNDRILMNYHEKIFFGVPLMYHFEMSYMRLVLQQVQIQYFQKGDMIVKYKDIISDIFIVTSGQVEIYNKFKEPLCLIGAAGVFGNIRRDVHSLSKIYVEARRNVELWVLNTQLFFNTVKYYPLIVQELENLLKSNPAYLTPVEIGNFDVFGNSKEVIDELESDEEPVKGSSSTTINTAKRSPRDWTKFSFRPDHIIIKVINFLTFIASLLNIYSITYIFATQEQSTLGYIYLFFEPIFYIRIFFKLHQSYTNVYGNVINSNKKICKRYLNNPRIVLWDIVPNLPIELIYYCFPEPDQFFFYSCLRLFHLLRFYYIQEYFQLQTDKLFRRNWWFLARFLVNYTIVVHVLSCIWFMLACPFNKCQTGTWIAKFNDAVFQQSALYKLILSYYYILDILTTTGSGDISSFSYSETVFTLIIMVIGKILISVFIGTVLKTLYVSEKHHLKYDMNLKLLRGYLEDKNISDFVLEKATSYLKNLWNHEYGVVDAKYVNSISYPLRQDIMFALYGDQGLDHSVLLQICTKLNRTVYFKDDYIVKTGDVNSTMYFIHSGEVIVLTKHPQLIETKHVILHPTDLFGVSQGLNLEPNHKFYYRAVGTTEILSLKFDDWSHLLAFFPRQKQQIFCRVQKEYYK